MSLNGKPGQYEARVAALAAAARELDLALEAYRAAKPALEQAKENWLDSLRRFNEKPASGIERPVATELPTELTEPAPPQLAGLA